jgi:hypothetical protein
MMNQMELGEQHYSWSFNDSMQDENRHVLLDHIRSMARMHWCIDSIKEQDILTKLPIQMYK